MPRVQPCSGRVKPCFVRPAIAQELPGGELPRIRRVGEVHDVQKIADAKEVLGEVERHAVRGEVALVANAAWQVDAGLQNRVAAVGRGVINRKIRPSVLADHEKIAPIIVLRSFVRGKRRGTVVQIRARLWVLRLRPASRNLAESLSSVDQIPRSPHPDRANCPGTYGLRDSPLEGGRFEPSVPPA